MIHSYDLNYEAAKVTGGPDQNLRRAGLGPALKVTKEHTCKSIARFYLKVQNKSTVCFLTEEFLTALQTGFDTAKRKLPASLVYVVKLKKNVCTSNGLNQQNVTDVCQKFRENFKEPSHHVLPHISPKMIGNPTQCL